MKKKIVHLINSLDNGGCERMLLRTLPLIDEYEHHIFTLKKKGTLAFEFERRGIPVFQVDNFFLLRNTIASHFPDLIITYLFHADAAARIFIRPFSKITVIPFLRSTYNSFRYFPALAFDGLTSGLVSHYFANSAAIRDQYVDKLHVPAAKISLIPNGIDLDLYKKSSALRGKYRKDLKIGVNDTVFLDVANFHPNKGHKHLIHAFSKIQKESSSAKLILVGDGICKNEIEKLVDSHFLTRSVLFLGIRSDVPALLNCSDIFVSPTYFEGMSNAIQEAMAAGVAVITTSIPENKLLIKSEFNGLLVPLNKEFDISLTSAMRRLMLNPKMSKRLGVNARLSIRNNYSLRSVARLWSQELSVYA
jgi:glycosyltransferase involved in cell wall biosynthesis